MGGWPWRLWWQVEHRPLRMVWLLSACLVLAYTTLAVTGHLLYQTYDESRLANLAEGIPEPNEYGCTIVLMHPWLGKGIAALAALAPGIRWFAIIVLATHVVALWRILDSLRRHGCGAGGLLAAASIGVLGYAMIEPGFTTAAALLVAAAVFPLLTPDRDAPGWAIRGGHGALSLVLLALGVGFRDVAAFLAFGTACAAFVVVRGGEILERSNPALRDVGAVAVAGVVLGCLALVGRTSPSTPEADRYRAYYRTNVQITDYRRTTFDPSWADPLGMSANDFAMIRRHFVTDSGPFCYEQLAALPANATRPTIVQAAILLAREATPGAWALIGVAIAGCVLQPRLAMTLCVSLAALVAIRWTCDRMQPRVAMPTLALPAMLAVASACQARWRAAWSWSWLAVVVLAGWLVLEPRSARARKLKVHQRDEAAAWAFCDAHGLSPFHWGPSGRSVEMFHRPIGAEAKAIRVGSWANSHPSRLKYLRSRVGADLYAALVQAGSYHVITGAGDRSVIETFLREHGPAGLRISKELEMERAVVLRVDVAADSATAVRDGHDQAARDDSSARRNSP